MDTATTAMTSPPRVILKGRQTTADSRNEG